jgi:hypothetical protein
MVYGDAVCDGSGWIDAGDGSNYWCGLNGLNYAGFLTVDLKKEGFCCLAI